MAISRMTVTGKEYYRVYRRWGNKTEQRYHPLDPDPKKAFSNALKDDAILEQRQLLYKRMRIMSAEYLINVKGRVRGIQMTRDHRYPEIKVYRVQIRIPWHKHQQRGWFSVNHYGDYEAFRHAVKWLCEYIGIRPNGELGKKLLSAYPNYIDAKPLSVALPESGTKDDDIDGWAEQLAHDVERFKVKNQIAQKRKKSVVNGR